MARRFDAEAAGDLDAVFELRLSDSGQRYAVHVAGGRCAVERRPAPEAGAQVSISSGDLVRLVSGAIPWTALLAHGRLELGGDPFLALRFPKLFRIGSR
jgi:putative sterol carrier protein